ncbi:MAG: DNA mismatch repair protein MutS [Tindallia sp. MSAO_Bac2]|nr:MAG: DNA mismatch repair protein MutS [Tindallia sp. MSAO_Bac2]
MAKLTPMMQQFFDIKNKYQDALLFFRLGDFYELFYDDALIASQELEITLTGRNCGQEERAPMCGVPHHSAQTYIDRLIKKGYKVAICEQVEDPETAPGIVKREVVRVVTPGTAYDSQILEEKNNHYLLSIHYQKGGWGMGYVDLSTGEMLCTQSRSDDDFLTLVNETNKIQPGEIIFSTESEAESRKLNNWLKTTSYFVSSSNDYAKDIYSGKKFLHEHFELKESKSFILSEEHLALPALVNLFNYLKDTQKRSLDHITDLIHYQLDDRMMLDQYTRKNLELTETLQDHEKKGSLLGILDKTKTAMGGRLLRKWVEEPLTDTAAINERLDAVTDFVYNPLLRKDLRRLMRHVYDIERLVAKVGLQSAGPRDLISLKQTLEQVKNIKILLQNESQSSLINKWDSMLDPHIVIIELLENAIADDPPVTLKDGGFIKEGFDSKIDELKIAAREGKMWIAEYEKKERDRTGIKTLKTGYNKVFGYYIEVSKSYMNSVPDEYQRKQTLSNCERYITDPLKELESKILGAEEQSQVLEIQAFKDIREALAHHIFTLQQTAKAVAGLDVMTALAEVAFLNQYSKPELKEDPIIQIENGRHPVVEKMLEQEMFVPNHTYMDSKDQTIQIITGPNMAGKSTYMRQVALIVLMAQIGSYVPADKVTLGVVDRIFTRIGASDDLSQGRSTFMMEMSEVSTILKEATPDSLIILDEVGRGTSTYDGLSIAWSVVKYIHQQIKAKTLFSTHYHELTELADILPGIKNYKVSVKEDGHDIIFLRKVTEGTSDKSYGVQVARLAGLPESLLTEAKDILEGLECGKDITHRTIPLFERKEKTRLKEEKHESGNPQIDKKKEKILQKISGTDVMQMSPLEALNYLYELQQELKETSSERTVTTSRHRIGEIGK